MKRWFIKILQFFLFLGIGIGLFVYLYRDQNAGELLVFIREKVDFFWIWLSLFFGVLSHLARALRWQMLIEPIERKPAWYTTAMAVFTGYLANLVFPRMGEVSRCGVLSRYENLSFSRLAGTVLAERLTDLILLLVLVLVALGLEYGLLVTFLKSYFDGDKIVSFFTSPWFWLIILLVIAIFWVVWKSLSRMKLFYRLKGLWTKFVEGFVSFKGVRSKPLYLFYSVFIWFMYFSMQYVAFFALPETSNLTVTAGIVILVTGSLGMLAPVQGGIGPWHAMVIATLALYGVTSEPAFAFALVVHGAQNLLVVALGLLSLIGFPLLQFIPKSQK